jgi:hypothetical protein
LHFIGKNTILSTHFAILELYIYGDVDYYDISKYRHVCGWCIGKDYMYLNYILSFQQTELAALPPLPKK